MSYFEFYCDNIVKNSDIIKGTCNHMCPPEEVAMREKERLVHVLEVMGPMKKLVKSFSRSAADALMAVPDALRPYFVLMDTVYYLLFDVTKRTDVSTTMVYDFVNDRLRAVRQDMTIQRLPPKDCIRLLEPMIRFHVLYGYKLCELPIKDYDPVLNQKYLLECLKWFLSCCDTIDESQSQQSREVDKLSNFLSRLDIAKKYKLECDRVLIECLYILCNLDAPQPLLRYLSLPKSLKSEPKLQLAYRISLANLKGNYIKVCMLIDQLCPLAYCAVCVYLPTLQRRALRVLSHAYNSKNLTVPASAVRHWLRYSSDADAIAACQHYGLAVRGDAIRFSRTEYLMDVATLQPKKLLLCDDKLNLSTDYVFTYK